jgi:hypothetical protein
MLSKLKSKITQSAVAVGSGTTIIQSAGSTVVNRVAGAVDAVTERAAGAYDDARERLTHPREAYANGVATSFGELEYMLAIMDGPVELTPALIAKLRDRAYQKNPH